nr:MAG TPA: hypothetical protein [Caudoviricetes sp.]
MLCCTGLSTCQMVLLMFSLQHHSNACRIYSLLVLRCQNTKHLQQFCEFLQIHNNVLRFRVRSCHISHHLSVFQKFVDEIHLTFSTSSCITSPCEIAERPGVAPESYSSLRLRQHCQYCRIGEIKKWRVAPFGAVGRDTLPTGVGGCCGIAPHSKTEESD